MIVAQEVADEVHDEGVPVVGVVVEGVVSTADDVVPTAVKEPSIPSSTPPTTLPQPSQDQPLTSHVHITLPHSPQAQPQSPQHQPRPSQDAGLPMDLLQNIMDTCTTLTRRVEHLEKDKIAQALKITKLKSRGRMIADMDADVDVSLEDAKEVIVEKSDAQIDQITAASATLTAATPQLTIDAASILTAPSVARRKNGVVIRDPQEIAPISSTIIHSEAKSKDKGKGILVEEPKPLKKQAQIEQDEAYARELEDRLNKNIEWDEVIDHVQRMQKEDNVVKRYQALKRNPQIKAQARKNMMIYLRNVTKEQMDEEDSRALKRLNKSQEDKAAKNQKLDEEVKELKRHLQIVPNDVDDVYTEATPLSCKVIFVDYEIYNEHNKPYFKIERADGSHQLYLSFLKEKSEVSLELLRFIRQQHQEGEYAKCLMLLVKDLVLPSQVDVVD
uniref:Uncharacterized protein n=1 Tax=Tanacetum cinerariifolium TaxID=118510 RepID=A0A699JK13_TANCI|nr:hypothetical protein [Tanacetum cinerariifolium]